MYCRFALSFDVDRGMVGISERVCKTVNAVIMGGFILSYRLISLCLLCSNENNMSLPKEVFGGHEPFLM